MLTTESKPTQNRKGILSLENPFITGIYAINCKMSKSFQLLLPFSHKINTGRGHRKMNKKNWRFCHFAQRSENVFKNIEV